MGTHMSGGRAISCKDQLDSARHLLYGCRPRFSGLYTKRHDAICYQFIQWLGHRGFVLQSVEASAGKPMMCQNGFPQWVRMSAMSTAVPELKTTRPDICLWSQDESRLIVVEVAVTSPSSLTIRSEEKTAK
jgi:hypothetical protein